MKMMWLANSILLLALAGASGHGISQVPVTPGLDTSKPKDAGKAGMSGKRVAILISDLHLGFGKVTVPPTSPGGAAVETWHRMEDFRWPMEFDAFLTAIEKQLTNAGKTVDLVILGDFLEMWQSVPGERDCVYDSTGAVVKDAKGPFMELKVRSNLSCSATDSLARARRAIAAHPDVLKRLGEFAGRGNNSVTIVPGNHDAGLVFQAVKRETLAAINAPVGRVNIASRGYWRSADGRTVAEHGHFIKGDVNSYGEFPARCLDLDEKPTPCDGPPDKTYLERPWGEKFVQDFYDRYEERFPIVDNITSEMAGFSAAINASSGSERLNAVGMALKFLLLQQSWRQFGALLGPKGEELTSAEWDVQAIRDGGDKFFEESLEPGNPLREDVKQLRLVGKLDMHVSTLPPEDIKHICDMRHAARLSMPQGQAPELCPGSPPTLGALKTKLLTDGAQRLADRMEELRTMLRAQAPAEPPDFDLYVYAHTHAVHGGCSAHETAKRSVQTTDGKKLWKPIAYNTGAWQRVVTPTRLKEMREKSPEKPFSDYVPEDLPACFSMIIVNQEADGPNAQPWFWAKKGAYWNFAPSCPEDPGQLPKVACSP